MSAALPRWMQTKGWALSRELQRLTGEQGFSTQQIADQWGVSRAYVMKIAIRYNLILGQGRHKRIAFFTSERNCKTIQILAAAAEVSVSTMIDQIVGTVVDEGVDAARRKLGKLARPKRPRATRTRTDHEAHDSAGQHLKEQPNGNRD